MVQISRKYNKNVYKISKPLRRERQKELENPKPTFLLKYTSFSNFPENLELPQNYVFRECPENYTSTETLIFDFRDMSS